MPSAPIQTRPLIRWPRERCRRTDLALGAEWLETNGLGDFAASTVAGCATRRYHGLLVARPPGNPKRHLFLARFEEHLATRNSPGEAHAAERWPLSMAAYPGVHAPEGQRSLEQFELAPYPSALYRRGEVSVLRETMLVRGQQTVLVRYVVEGARPGAQLELEPLFAFREADALTVENDVLATKAQESPDGYSFKPYPALPALELTVSSDDRSFESRPTWYKNVHYAADEERGYDHLEDQFSPGVLRLPISGARAEFVLAATIGTAVEDPAVLWRSESRRRRASLDALDDRAPGAGQDLAAEAFLYTDPAGRLGVNAGYPWFGEWGRDTFIALPGLTLGRDQPERCFDALSGALDFLQDGLLPNVYGLDRDGSAYDSVDAALWFARATRLFERTTGDSTRTADCFLPALLEIAEAYRDGTKLGMAMDEGGLLHAGSPELNATWMDAQIDGHPVTPRDGCAVEINALWYSLLTHVEKLVTASRSKRAAAPWRQLRLLARRTFLERFWLADEGYLADRWVEGVADTRVRPNMVIAAALEFSPLTRPQRRSIVERARAELLTPFGLRTLSPADPDYEPIFAGDPAARDGAYHQGTAWPWLLGFFAEAQVRAQGVTKKSLAGAVELWSSLEEHLDVAGLNHLSEVFSGNEPHAPGGCFAQAWNTGEYLRIRAAARRGAL